MKRVDKIGAFLKQARINAGWTQMDAAKLLGYKSAQYVSNFERGVCMASLTTAIKLCDKYKIPRSEIHKLYVTTYADQTKELLFSRTKRTA